MLLHKSHCIHMQAARGAGRALGSSQHPGTARPCALCSQVVLCGFRSSESVGIAEMLSALPSPPSVCKRVVEY